MEFGYLDLVLTFSGDDLRPVQRRWKLHRPDAYSDVFTWEHRRIFLLPTRQGVEVIKPHRRATAATGKQKGYKQ